jgi:hypothetical protein
MQLAVILLSRRWFPLRMAAHVVEQRRRKDVTGTVGPSDSVPILIESAFSQ